MSKKQKLNTKSSTESKLVGVNDAATMILWTKLFLEAQPGLQDQQECCVSGQQECPPFGEEWQAEFLCWMIQHLRTHSSNFIVHSNTVVVRTNLD